MVKVKDMDKKVLFQLAREGKIILRAQYNPRKNCWIIAQATLKGGWSRFGNSWFLWKDQCEDAIRGIVERGGKQYMIDN
jgi:hypothetical protein